MSTAHPEVEELARELIARHGREDDRTWRHLARRCKKDLREAQDTSSHAWRAYYFDQPGVFPRERLKLATVRVRLAHRLNRAWRLAKRVRQRAKS